MQSTASPRKPRRASSKRQPRSAEALSVQLPRGLSVRVAAQARSRGIEVEAAARTLIDERLRDLEDASSMEAARRWQSQQAQATVEKLRAGDETEASEDEIEAEFEAALRGVKARSA